MTTFEIIYIIVLHWIGDLLLQNSWMATNKSRNIQALFYHVLVYTGTMSIGLSFLLPGFKEISLFAGITMFTHLLTDYHTSRYTRTLYKRKKFYGFPGFFTVIGLDQVLHYIQLILTIKLIENV